MTDERPPVLIVDDRPDNLLALEGLLEPLGVHLVRAGSGEEALRYLLQHDCAVILLDVQMPGMDGLETARLIKGRERTRSVPIIFLTAIDGDVDHYLAGYGTGAVDYLTKPFVPEILRAKVAVFAELYAGAKLIEAQRQLLAQRLDERDRARAALAHQAAELERSNAELERFALLVSHDLREPILVLRGLTDLLATSDLSPDEAAETAQRLGAGFDAMRVVLDRLLDYSRVSGDAHEPVLTPLEDVLAAARAELEPELDGVEAAVTHDPLPVVRGDPWELERVFTHLLDNAVRFRGRSEPRIHVGLARRDDEWVITVQDNGVGIPEADIPRLFSVFLPLHPREEGGGSGLGLAIVRRAVSRHGGRVWAESVPGQGTAVSFTLPVDLAPAESAPAESVPAGG
jgi:hypothetical protein